MKIRQIYYNTVKQIFNERVGFESMYKTLLQDLNENEKRRLINLVNQFFRNFSFVEDYIIKEIDENFDNQKFDIAMIILCAGVEHIFLDKSVGYAVVNDYVEIAKRKVGIYKAKYVNAILRKLVEKDKTTIFDKTLDESLLKNARASHPDWIIERFEKFYGKEKTDELLKFNQTVPSIYIRINNFYLMKNQISKKKLIEDLLNADSVKTEKVKYFSKDYLKIIEGNVVNSYLFKKGAFYIQDPSHSLPVLLLEPKKNEKILDLCSAPGGKATYIQEITNNKVKLYLNDIAASKKRLIKENFKRLGVKYFKLTTEDAQKFSSFDEFDKILIDIPCSGSGNFRRHPESRWNREEDDVEELLPIQAKILERAKRYVKRGGIIVYSTCSLFDDENVLTVKKFLEFNEGDYIVENIDYSSEKTRFLRNFEYEKGGYLVDPAKHGFEGAFAVRIKRIR